MRVLGISAYYHDSAVTLIENGEIKSAAQEERFTRIKHDANFPVNALKYCINEENIDINQLDYVCFYEKPFLKFERLLETYLSFAPKGFRSFKMAIPIWVREKLFQKNLLIKELMKIGANDNIKKKILFSEHHLSHAASAFYPSSYTNAAILTLDGVGEWATSTVGLGNKEAIEIIKEIEFPHSLGLLYSAFTYYAGFKVNSGEYKLMGLAPYGQPIYYKTILDTLVDVKNDGSFRLNQRYFDYCTGLRMTNKKFDKLFGHPPRKSEAKLNKFYMDIAASIQKVLEYIVIKICRNIKKETKQKNLCMAGGVALNCVANGKILKEGIFDNVWIQPAAGDAGGSLGAALLAYHKNKTNIKHKKYDFADKMKGSLLGPKYNSKEIEVELKKMGAIYEKLNFKNMISNTVKALRSEKVVGWFQGRMEFGPRALGNRSILADPRSETMQKNLNLKIKFRESFRPFAPSIIKEKIGDWFDGENESPYMLFVYKLNKKKIKKSIHRKQKYSDLNDINNVRSVVPAITHIDKTARVQTVDKITNPKYYKLIEFFYNKTKCPILINTSFNIRGEPIVCSPKDAFRCFMGTNMDVLVLENFILYKENQKKELMIDYRTNFLLD